MFTKEQFSLSMHGPHIVYMYVHMQNGQQIFAKKCKNRVIMWYLMAESQVIISQAFGRFYPAEFWQISGPWHQICSKQKSRTYCFDNYP